MRMKLVDQSLIQKKEQKSKLRRLKEYEMDTVEFKKAEKTKATLCKEIGQSMKLSQSEMTSLERTSKEMLLKIQGWIS